MEFRALFLGAAKISFQLALFIIFLFYFGLPAVEKYNRKDVMVVDRMKNTDGIPVPDITVSIWNESVYDSCLQKEGELIETCIEAAEKNLPQLDSIVFGSKRQKSIDLTNVSVHEDFTHVGTAKTVTFNIPFNIGPEDDEQLYIFLDPRFEYQISVHDPKFFIFTDNAAFIPLMKHHSSGYYYPIELTEMVELDTPSDPCHSDMDYSFHECIRKSVAQQVLKKVLSFELLKHFSGWL